MNHIFPIQSRFKHITKIVTHADTHLQYRRRLVLVEDTIDVRREKYFFGIVSWSTYELYFIVNAKFLLSLPGLLIMILFLLEIELRK